MAAYDLKENANDKSPNSLHGALYGSPTFIDNRLLIDANAEYMQVADSDLFSFGSDAFSIAFNVIIFAFTVDNFIANKRASLSNTNGGLSEWQLFFENSKLYFMLFDSSKPVASYIGIATSSVLNPNTEYKCALIFGGGIGNAFKLYINGILVETNFFTAGNYEQTRNTTSPMRVGNPGWTTAYNRLNGYVKNLYIYKRELNFSEVIALNKL